MQIYEKIIKIVRNYLPEEGMKIMQKFLTIRLLHVILILIFPGNSFTKSLNAVRTSTYEGFELDISKEA